MFGFIGKAASLAVDVALSPVTAPVRMAGQALELLDGLTEGEIRTEVIARFGSDAVKDLALDDIITLYKLM